MGKARGTRRGRLGRAGQAPAESRLVNGRFVSALRSGEGHVVVRVGADGRYRIFVTDSRDENDRVVLSSTAKASKLLR